MYFEKQYKMRFLLFRFLNLRQLKYYFNKITIVFSTFIYIKKKSIKTVQDNYGQTFFVQEIKKLISIKLNTK